MLLCVRVLAEMRRGVVPFKVKLVVVVGCSVACCGTCVVGASNANVPVLSLCRSVSVFSTGLLRQNKRLLMMIVLGPVLFGGAVRAVVNVV